MIPALLLDNLLAWSAQVCLLVAVGALAALTLPHPRARLLFWQGILTIALLLPAVEPWSQPPPEPVAPLSIAPTSAPVELVHHSSFRFVWRREDLLLLIAAGAVLRLLWIGSGLLRLRRHRLDAQMLTIPPVPFSNPRVRWFVSNTVGGPVTFGFLNPAILLPARVAEMPADLREAIAHHELAHVRRRDWLFVLFEEAIRSLLWFHPAIWLVLSRIQLAREQVVDAEVVGLTCDRARYLDALVAVAAQRLLPDVAPASLFLKKRQLALRVAAVLKETRISKLRLFLNFTTVCSAALAAAVAAVWMFPMQAPAQTSVTANASTAADGPGVLVEPGAKLLHRSPVFYPSGVTTTGTVIVESTLNAKGEVTDARVTSGPDELRNAALSSVLNWHFSPDGGAPPTVQSTIHFVTPPHTAEATVTATAPVVPTQPYLKSIEINGLSDELAEKVTASLPVHVGDGFGMAEMRQVRAAVTAVDEHLIASYRLDRGDAVLTIRLRSPGVSGRGVAVGIPGVVTEARAAVMSAQLARIQALVGGSHIVAQLPIAANGVERIQVGGSVQSFNLIKKVVPLYPPLAKQARVQGTVRFTALIGADGSVVSLQLIEGHPLLVEAAKDAVAQWQYKPTLLNGAPVEVVTEITVNFSLSQ